MRETPQSLYTERRARASAPADSGQFARSVNATHTGSNWPSGFLSSRTTVCSSAHGVLPSKVAMIASALAGEKSATTRSPFSAHQHHPAPADAPGSEAGAGGRTIVRPAFVSVLGLA